MTKLVKRSVSSLVGSNKSKKDITVSQARTKILQRFKGTITITPMGNSYPVYWFQVRKGNECFVVEVAPNYIAIVG